MSDFLLLRHLYVYLRLFFICLCAFYEVLCLKLYAFCANKSIEDEESFYLAIYAFYVHKDVYEESLFLCFLCLWDLFSKGIKLPHYHHLLYYFNTICTVKYCTKTCHFEILISFSLPQSIFSPASCSIAVFNCPT